MTQMDDYTSGDNQRGGRNNYRRDHKSEAGERTRGNNPSSGSATNDITKLYCDLSNAEKARLLYDNGYLFGIHIDSNDGPRRATRQVASQKGDGSLPSAAIQEHSELVTEFVPSTNARDANFVHQGWSSSATSATSPWIKLRIAKTNEAQPNADSWVTKRTLVQQLKINLSAEDLVPTPAFVDDVQMALAEPTRSAKFQALNKVFQFWGDVIPLEYDLGISLSTTDLQANFDQLPNPADLTRHHNFVGSKKTRLSTQGWDGNDLPHDNMESSLKPVPPGRWRQVKITRVIPITDLLTHGVVQQLIELYSTLLSFRPQLLIGSTSWSRSFDSIQCALKVVSGVVIRSEIHIDALSLEYLDGTCSEIYGGPGGTKHVFSLNCDEHITEVMLWSDEEWVYGLQFTTSHNRISLHYGGNGGIPTILNNDDGVLCGFSGTVKTIKWQNYKTDVVSQTQVIWRHDILQTRLNYKEQHCEYFGGAGGRPFNDWYLVGPSGSIYISSIRVRCGSLVDGIEITYGDNRNGIKRVLKSGYHGGAGGKAYESRFEPEDHIVSVSGRYGTHINQLCFVTTQGRTSGAFGGNEGIPFLSQAPLASDGSRMRLRYIAGKSARFLDGILFVWTQL